MATTIHLGDCTSDCAVCVMQCDCEKCANVFCCGACGEIVGHEDGEQITNQGFIEFVHKADLCSANDEILTEMCGKCGEEKEAINGKIEYPHKDYAVFICNDCKGE